MQNQEARRDKPMQRILVFRVDDGLFGFHLGWADAVYPSDSMEIYRLKTRRTEWQQFFIHEEEPAFVADLRRLFGLGELLGAVDRQSFVVVRCGSFRLAIAVDECVGVQPLQLDAEQPLPSSLTRDGGMSVAHLIDWESGVLAILDPNRLLAAEEREALDPLYREARDHVKRTLRIASLWERIREEPTVADLRQYARLCRRNGRSAAASSTRAVVKHLEGGAGAAVSGGVGADELVRDLVHLWTGRENGRIELDGEGGGSEILVSEGRVVDAQHAGEWGRRAFERILAMGDASYRFHAGDADVVPRIADSTVALVLSTLENRQREEEG